MSVRPCFEGRDAPGGGGTGRASSATAGGWGIQGEDWAGRVVEYATRCLLLYTVTSAMKGPPRWTVMGIKLNLWITIWNLMSARGHMVPDPPICVYMEWEQGCAWLSSLLTLNMFSCLRWF